ncbi:hypothetical protein [Chitinophaga caseinilytica]|uniref:Tetratricopeptide repeat protein n=1 Tax=Chitinophaga caseinilytica TaxID=2267521 RepID=A0ABZ2Z9L2_9BACT
MNWKRFTVYSGSALAMTLAGAAYVWSCGGEADPYDYYTSMFNPNLAEKPGFEPFYYTALTDYYAAETPEQTLNLQEWGTFFNGKVSKDDLTEFIYTYSRPQMSTLYNHIEKNQPLQLPDSVEKNGLTKYFLESKDRETLGYLMYAKQCEANSGSDNPWEEPKRDSVAMLRLAKNGMQLYRAAQNPQIRERYAFQSVRMAHFAKNYNQALQYYDSLAAPLKGESLIHYRTLALKAGALMRTGKKAQSAYLFSQIFDKVPSQRRLAFLNMKWAGVYENSVLQLCKTPYERGTITAIYAMRQTDYYPQGLEQTYAHDPKHPLLDVLLSREIAKLEENYLTAALGKESGMFQNYYESSEYAPDKVENLREVVNRIAKEGKVKETSLYHISSAYLSYIMRDFKSARASLATAQTLPARPAVKDQFEVVKLLLTIAEQPRLDAPFEQALLPSLRWLDTKLPKQTDREYWYDPAPESLDGDFYSRLYRNLMDFIIAPRYAKQGDPVRQALALSVRDRVKQYQYYWTFVSAKSYITDSLSTNAMISLYNGRKARNQSPYEAYLYQSLKLSENELGEAIAISYVRNHQFADAVEWFKRSGSSRKTELALRPQLQDYGYTDPDSLATPVTELQFAEKMVSLEKEMKKSKVNPETYFEYANGLFSFSYYGAAYHLAADYRPSTDWWQPEYDKTPWLKEYYGCYRAEEYYKKAADASTDPEFKAKALFLAARCAQKHLPYSEQLEWHMQAIRQNPYFPALQADYKNTRFYQDIIKECGYLRDFAKAQKP